MGPYQSLDRLPWHRRLWFIAWNWTIVGPIGLSTDRIETVEELRSLGEAIAVAVDEPSAEADQQLAYLLAERAERLRTIHLNRLRVAFVMLWPPAALCWLAITVCGALPLLVRRGLPANAGWRAPSPTSGSHMGRSCTTASARRGSNRGCGALATNRMTLHDRTERNDDPPIAGDARRVPVPVRPRHSLP
jgi:hypothetical protein